MAHQLKNGSEILLYLNVQKNRTDAKLYAKYGLSEGEIAYIERMIKAM